MLWGSTKTYEHPSGQYKGTKGLGSTSGTPAHTTMGTLSSGPKMRKADHWPARSCPGGKGLPQEEQQSLALEPRLDKGPDSGVL